MCWRRHYCSTGRTLIPSDMPLLRHALRAGFAVRYGILHSFSRPREKECLGASA
jgi:hypothetical protein